jgi:3-oxoadipate enol-lactonase
MVIRILGDGGDSIRLRLTGANSHTQVLTLTKADVTDVCNEARRGSRMNIRVNGITLAYDDRGTGLPVVFLHAFPLNRTMWADQVETLSSHFRVISVDLRGHGESDAPLWHYSLDQAADDVCGLLGHLAIRQAVFVGLSMGGYLLFALYRRHTDRVSGLVLADTRAQADTPEGKEGRFQMAQTAYKNGPSAVADIMIPKLLSQATIRTKPEIVQRVRMMIEGNQVSGIAGDLMAMAERPDSIMLLKQIRCPTQVIVGELDQATPPSDAKLMADQIPGARMVVIPEAAHLANLEQPELFTQIVRSFAENVAETGSR